MSINKEATLSINGVVVGKVKSIGATRSLLPCKSIEPVTYVPSEAGPFAVTITRTEIIKDSELFNLLNVLKEEQKPQNN